MYGRVLSSGTIDCFTVVAMLTTPFTTAEAHGFSRFSHDWRHHRDGRTIVILASPPRRAIHLRYGDGTYYYCRGRYYKQMSRGYVVVPAPVGVVIETLPPYHRVIVINGITYHEYDGVYYKGGPTGYTVVPIATTPDAGASTAPEAELAGSVGSGSIVVNVPNKNGSYTPVTLQPANGGMYIGPQGEVYPNFPQVAQLQEMYGK